jgi:hypothetical protein
MPKIVKSALKSESSHATDEGKLVHIAEEPSGDMYQWP